MYKKGYSLEPWFRLVRIQRALLNGVFRFPRQIEHRCMQMPAGLSEGQESTFN